MGALLQAAYYAKDAYDLKIEEDEFQKVYQCEEKNDLVRVYITRENLVFSFRGSDLEFKDWASNINTGFFDDQHRGFELAFDKLKPFIIHYIKGNLSKKILIRGHSRGAALGTNCSRFLAEKMGIPIASCITFGCPRIYRSKLRDEYNTLPIYHTNVINGWDLFASMPTYIQGFRRAGINIQLPQPFYHRALYFKIKDHDLDEYIKSLQKNKGKLGE